MKCIKLTREDTQRGSLILVTPDHALPEAGRPKEVVPFQAPCGAQGSDAEEARRPGVLLEKNAAEMLKKLLRDLKSDDRIVPVSGFRSHEEQIRIWNDTLAKEGETFTRTYVAKPGHSEHESGLAIDLAENRDEIDFIRPEFPREGICGEFRRLASGYGFIERYPAGGEAVTGIGAEPWHFRYAGVPHGAVMEQEGLILEEYIAFLREHTSKGGPYLYFSPEDESCTEIFYADLRGKETYTFQSAGPEEIRYSGTNEGGIVICRRRRR